MTPAAFRYIGTIYETCIDRGMDVEAIRLYLLSRGVALTPAQVTILITSSAFTNTV
jgi:hypothetical protein